MNTKTAEDLARKRCASCEGAVAALAAEEVRRYLADMPEWKLSADGKHIRREWRVKDFASGLGPLGKPQSLVQASQGLRGGMTLRVYVIRFPQKILRAWTYEMPDGKLEQYQIAAQN